MSIRLQADNDQVRDCQGRSAARAFHRFRLGRETGLEGVGDPQILELAAGDNRVLVSHDRRTMLNHFRKRLEAGKASPGLLVASQGAPIGLVVEAIVLLWAVIDPAELRDQVYHLPSLIHHTFPR